MSIHVERVLFLRASIVRIFLTSAVLYTWMIQPNDAIDLPGCRIPDYFWNSTERQPVFSKPFQPPDSYCESAGPLLFNVVVETAMGVACLVLNTTAYREAYNGTDINHMQCTYQAVEPSLYPTLTTASYMLGRSVPLKLPVECYFEPEFVWIDCTVPLYEQPAFLPLVERSTAQLRNQSRKESSRLNVIVLGVDSVSRQALYRLMPRTRAWLKSRPDRVVELRGYSKMSSDSPANVFPFLTGRRFYQDIYKLVANKRYLDDVARFLWENFAEAGYRTMFAEEMLHAGLFHYAGTRGFEKPPVHYWLEPITSLINERGRKCFSGTLAGELYLDYMYNLLRLLGPCIPLWAFTWLNSFSHEADIEPALYDTPVERFLTRLEDVGLMNQSVVLFIASHGRQSGLFRATDEGRIEDSLPFGYVLLPPSLIKAWPEALTTLRTNSQRLVTLLDLRELLLDVLEFTNRQAYIPIGVGGAHTAARVTERELMPHEINGTSLIAAEVPLTRTCEDARIEPQHCPCEPPKVEADNEFALFLAVHAVRHINDLVSDSSAATMKPEESQVCLHWDLVNVTQVTSFYINQEETLMYRITFVTRPPATFEAIATVEKEMWTLYEVTWTDRYSQFSQCATKPARRDCYCIYNDGNHVNNTTSHQV